MIINDENSWPMRACEQETVNTTKEQVLFSAFRPRRDLIMIKTLDWEGKPDGSLAKAIKRL